MVIQLIHCSIVLPAIGTRRTGYGDDASTCSKGIKDENAKTAGQPAALPPILGIRGRLVTCISTRDYIELVDATGRQWHPAKRGRITGRPPAVLGQLGIAADQWVNRVRAVKPDGGFCRAIGSEEALLDKAATIGQRWLRGLGIARSLAN